MSMNKTVKIFLFIQVYYFKFNLQNTLFLELFVPRIVIVGAFRIKSAVSQRFKELK
jgi:hypothetical protein